MTSRIGTKGQVVIPKAIRDKVGLYPGSTVDFTLTDGEIRIRTVKQSLKRTSLQGKFNHSGMAAQLLEDRRKEEPC